MKSHFKYALLLSIFLFSSNAFSRDIILIENLASHAQGQTLLKIIEGKFKIPRKLITYRSVNTECAKTSEAIMQLCLKADGELDIVKLNKFAVENSLRVFLEVEE